jgi:hypothetical protein
MADIYGLTNIPGMQDAAVTSERWALWAGASWYLLKGVVVDGTNASDAGNTPTTELRHGLLMAIVSNKAVHYQPNAATGAEKVIGFLWEPRSTLDSDATARDCLGQLCVCGPVKNGSLLLLDQQARAQMYNRFIFDDDIVGNSMGWQRVIAKTADYTVLSTDNNTIFTNKGATGAVNFTLPTIAKGLRFRFFVEADQTLTLTSVPSDSLVVFNDAAADTIAYSTASEKIGGGFEVVANSDATKWLVFVHLGIETQTPVIAT